MYRSSLLLDAPTNFQIHRVFVDDYADRAAPHNYYSRAQVARRLCTASNIVRRPRWSGRQADEQAYQVVLKAPVSHVLLFKPL